MGVKIAQIGKGNVIMSDRVLAVVRYQSLPIRRAVDAVADKGLVLDATNGKRVRSVVIMDTGLLILTGLTPGKVAERLGRTDLGAPEVRGAQEK